MSYKILIAALAVAFSVANAAAQDTETWTGPDNSQRGYLIGHPHENFEIAVTEVCFPYIFQNSEANTWLRRPRPGIVWRPDGGILQGLTAYQIGGSSAASAGVGDRGVGRECTVEPDSRMDPEDALTTLRGLIARMPLAMTQTNASFDPGVFERRLAWCSPADGPQIVVLASIAAADRRRGTPAMFATILEGSERDPRCDAPTN